MSIFTLVAFVSRATFNPFSCAGTSLINLALGFRLQNKHQCITQGLAFLFKNLQQSENSQVFFTILSLDFWFFFSF